MQNAPSERLLARAGKLAVSPFTMSELGMLFTEAGLTRFMPKDPYAKTDLVDGGIRAALAKSREPAVATGLWTLVELIAERLARAADGEIVEDRPLWTLREALRADGMDFAADPEDGPVRTPVRFLPLDEPAAPLSKQITKLEADFESLGLTVALTHYRQAVDNVQNQNFEAANSQLRAMYEAVLVRSAKTVGFSSAKAGAGGPAISYLRTGGHLSDEDGGMFVQGLWKMTHTNGPHPGTTTAGETHFRMLTITGAARYLIDRFFLAPESDQED